MKIWLALKATDDGVIIHVHSVYIKMIQFVFRELWKL